MIFAVFIFMALLRNSLAVSSEDPACKKRPKFIAKEIEDNCRNISEPSYFCVSFCHFKQLNLILPNGNIDMVRLKWIIATSVDAELDCIKVIYLIVQSCQAQVVKIKFPKTEGCDPKYCAYEKCINNNLNHSGWKI